MGERASEWVGKLHRSTCTTLTFDIMGRNISVFSAVVAQREVKMHNMCVGQLFC